MRRRRRDVLKSVTGIIARFWPVSMTEEEVLAQHAAAYRKRPRSGSGHETDRTAKPG